MRYIELNPVRASMVNHTGEYQWSSYHKNALGQEDELVEAHPLYTKLGLTAAEQQHAYRDLFRMYIDDASIHEIRNALNHEVVLGRSYFKDKIEEIPKRQTRINKPGRPRVEDKQGTYIVFS